MPRFPRCMRPSYTNHNVTKNLAISIPYAGIEPAEREARTTTVDRACRGANEYNGQGQFDDEARL